MTGRFAPSPTGALHLGSLRTALVAWLFARSTGQPFLLRIEDIDPDRCRAAWAPIQIEALTALGLDWDGPVVRQSTRLELYAEAFNRLAEAGRVYPCFCTRAQLRAGRASGAAGAGAGASDADAVRSVLWPAGAYPGTCAGLDPDLAAARVAAGERHAWRFRAGPEIVDFEDGLAGPRRVASDDPILRRADGVVAYTLAVVVDDGAQGVTEVVRGGDLLDSVGRQAQLMDALGLARPRWAHVPLVLGPDGRRLAKRHGDRIHLGLADETLAWLARSLGSPSGGASRPRRAGDLLGSFSPAAIPSKPVAVA